MMHMRGILVAVSVSLALAGCGANASTAASPASQTLAVTVERARIPQPQAVFSGPGSVVAAHTYQLAFEIPGRVASVNADVGDRVAAGSTLASLVDDDYRAQLSAAQASAAQAHAQARKALSGARPQEKASAHDAVRSAQAQLDQAQAALTLARANALRSQHLFVEGAISAQANDSATAAQQSAQAGVDAARAALVSARNQASLVDTGARSEDRAAALAQAAGADAASDLAAITLRKTVLVAPAGAFVLRRTIDVGDEVAPGVVAFTLTSAGAPDVIVSVPEANSEEITAGMPAVVTAGDRLYDARVTRIDPEADPVTRTVQVRLHAAALSLRPGAVVIAAIGTQRPQGTSIPLPAILTAADGGTSVAIADPHAHTARHVPVHLLSLQGDRAIVSGLRPGELVITAGQYSVHPGQHINIVSTVN
ncbi:MAG TPA: efflux RND transporter periplasmic adaptor subunit [Candidatus Acidoferrales bacterium]|nr:efflux RND transporter periplasmic adaptor subunit [Candidatus Acidoferrales bacterium]